MFLPVTGVVRMWVELINLTNHPIKPPSLKNYIIRLGKNWLREVQPERERKR